MPWCIAQVASAFTAAPDVPRKLRELVVMGGDMRVNAYFDIDLNLILSDRGAAQTIFHMSAEDAPRNVVVVPIQTCTQVRSCVAHAIECRAPNLTPQLQVAFTVEEIAQLRACCPTSAGCQHLTKLAKAVDDSPPPINEMFRGDGYDRNRSPRASGGFFPWDLVAVMAVLRRDLFSEWAPHHITVHRWQSEFTPASDDQPGEALEGHDVAMHVTVPMRVIDERAVLADALQRICRVAHVEPELIGTSALLIPSNRRFFRGIALAFALLLLVLLVTACVLVRRCCRPSRKVHTS